MFIKTRPLRKKLLLFFMVLVPLCIILVCSCALYVYVRANASINKTQAYTNQLIVLAKTDPDLMTDKTFLIALDNKAKQLKIGVALSKNKAVLYSFNPFFNSGLEKQAFSLKTLALKFKDGSSGKMLIYTYLSFAEQVTYHYPLIIVLFIFFVVIANGIFAIYVSNEVISPITKLTQATRKIIDGKLDFVILAKGNGEISQLANTFNHMRSRLKESMEQITEYNEKSKWSIASFTHDFASPLMAARGYVQGIMDGVANTPEKQKLYLEIINIKLKETEDLYRRFLIFYKLNMNQVQFNEETFDILAFMARIINDYCYQASANEAQIRFHNDIQSHAVYTDELYLKRIVTNIIDNSFKYADDKLVLDINVHDKDEQFLVFHFQDNGPGITKEEVPYIFDRFYRAKHNRAVKGSGLGLAIAYQAIKALGGEIGVEPGRGFHIWFTVRKHP